MVYFPKSSHIYGDAVFHFSYHVVRKIGMKFNLVAWYISNKTTNPPCSEACILRPGTVIIIFRLLGATVMSVHETIRIIKLPLKSAKHPTCSYNAIIFSTVKDVLAVEYCKTYVPVVRLM